MKKTDTKITHTEIEKSLKDLHEKLRVIRFAMAGSRAKNVKEQGNIRKEIARLLTTKNSLGAQK